MSTNTIWKLFFSPNTTSPICQKIIGILFIFDFISKTHLLFQNIFFSEHILKFFLLKRIITLIKCTIFFFGFFCYPQSIPKLFYLSKYSKFFIFLFAIFISFFILNIAIFSSYILINYTSNLKTNISFYIFLQKRPMSSGIPTKWRHIERHIDDQHVFSTTNLVFCLCI